MKKLSITIACMSLACASWAHDVEVDGIYYNLIEKAKEAEVTFRGASYDDFSNEYSGAVTIPSSIVVNEQEYAVTSIGEHAFYCCYELTSVTIPNSVKNIQEHAFSICSSLSYVDFGNSVTNIGEYAFGNCESLTTASIPNSVTKVEARAFFRCSALDALSIGESVTSIDVGAFSYCTSLTTVSIPNSVTSIGNGAFANCSSLTAVTIGTTLESLCSNTFSNCSALKSFVIDSANPFFTAEDCVIYSKDKSVLVCCASSKEGEFIIPNSVTRIGTNAFENCSALTAVVIPNFVTNIESWAFEGCSGLTSITIPNSVTGIDGWAFHGCTGLASVSIGQSVGYIQYAAFGDCTSLTSITIPSSVRDIDERAFSSCTSLSSVTFGESVEYIRERAFANCKELSVVTCLAEAVPNTASDAFENCYVNYTTLKVPAASAQAYKTTAPWSEFGKFETADGSEIPVPMVCATPVVTYENGELHFSCETEGATYHCNMQIPGQISIESTGVAKLPDSYTILVTAYATAEGYEPSEKATTTFTISVCDVNGDGIVSIADVDALVNKILGRTNGSSSDPYNGHDYVDLGVVVDGKPVYWATTNIGAEQPADYGLYFAWGETEGYGSSPRGEREKDELGMVQIPILDDRLFSWSSYSSDLCDGRANSLKKYCTDSSYGTVDNKTVLAPEDDAAHVNWQGKWRMPTKQEQEALLEQCVWTWSAMTNSSGESINGYKISNKVDSTKFIFLPAAGGRDNGYLDEEGSRGNYWSASLSVGNSGYAYGLDFYSGNWFSASHGRYGGLSIRPVCQ